VGYFKKQKHSATKLQDHVRELTLRMSVSFMTLLAISLVAYFFYEPIIDLLRVPLGETLYYNNPTGSFIFIMKICFMIALAITIPVLVYNLIMFIRPAFSGSISKKRIYFTTLFSSILAFSGVAFAYYVILPGSLNFFAGFQVEGLSALISADSYLRFVTNVMITFILVFQLPLVISFIDHIKPLQPGRLLKAEKWVLLGSLAVALLVPFSYDLATSLLIAVPIVVLYNLSIVMVVVGHAVNKKSPATVAKQTIIPDITVTENLVKKLADELEHLSQPTPIVNTSVDFNSVVRKAQTNAVQPPAWVVERNKRREALYKQFATFSETQKSAGSKRILVS
jgi:sec-independent protein translocase protein TatC